MHARIIQLISNAMVSVLFFFLFFHSVFVYFQVGRQETHTLYSDKGDITKCKRKTTLLEISIFFLHINNNEFQ